MKDDGASGLLAADRRTSELQRQALVEREDVLHDTDDGPGIAIASRNLLTNICIEWQYRSKLAAEVSVLLCYFCAAFAGSEAAESNRDLFFLGALCIILCVHGAHIAAEMYTTKSMMHLDSSVSTRAGLLIERSGSLASPASLQPWSKLRRLISRQSLTFGTSNLLANSEILRGMNIVVWVMFFAVASLVNDVIR